ncbi:MAG: PH domain-containing protein [Pontixanthobacter sp.]
MEPTPSASPPIEPATVTPNRTGLTPLHPNHVKLTRIVACLYALPIIAIGVALEFAVPGLPGIVIVPVLILAALIVFRIPLRRYHARGYDMGSDRLRVVRGILFNVDTVVPFGRIQHIDVDQGPLQRAYGLATLTVHTAGTHNASVHLPGLENGHAKAMREEMRAHIGRETR